MSSKFEILTKNLVKLLQKVADKEALNSAESEKLNDYCNAVIQANPDDSDAVIDATGLALIEAGVPHAMHWLVPRLEAQAETGIVVRKGKRSRQGILFCIGIALRKDTEFSTVIEPDIERDITYVLKDAGVVSEEAEVAIIPRLFDLEVLADLNFSEVAYLSDCLSDQVSEEDYPLSFPPELERETSLDLENFGIGIKLIVGFLHTPPEDIDAALPPLLTRDYDKDEPSAGYLTSGEGITWADALRDCIDDHLAGGGNVTSLTCPEGFFEDIRCAKELIREEQLLEHVNQLAEANLEGEEDLLKVDFHPLPESAAGFTVNIFHGDVLLSEGQWLCQSHELPADALDLLIQAINKCEDIAGYSVDAYSHLKAGTMALLH